ncbi:ABC transporter permease [Conexibacter sp. CPCC 206217]|uniref:ABC transporter permease n=1 Tax=Conexibacter sp. CPCC 206217 TaxID=3064574 RepID=UPI00271CAF60|nr:ABC transporter permease [Conexibacter sp. CPCC 206217]MDO8210343.1 ABC transporter permease [Conexibacter sp. CPCC 206217]
MSAVPTVQAPVVERAAGPLARLWRSGSGRMVVVAAFVALVVLLLPLVLPSPTTGVVADRLRSPSFAHPFGTDAFGRDVFSRVITGARATWTVGLAAAVLSLLVGGAIGAAAAVSGRFGDSVLMRLMDVVLAFPATLLALVLAIAIGPGVWTVVIVVAFVYSAQVARFVRSLVRRETTQEYVEAARLVGSSRRRVLGYHVGINVLPTLLVYQMTIAADAILVEAGLSYLGAGVRPPTPSWGGMIQEGQELIFSGVWWTSLFPGIAIAITALVLNAIADRMIADISLDR